MQLLLNRYCVLVTCFAVLWFAVGLNAQIYTPVVINGEAFFSTELETAAGNVPSEVTVANFEEVDGVLYNRVFFKRNLEADMLIGYLREDPGTSQIYFRETTDPQEYLVFDLSLEVGETISLHARWCDGLPGDEATVVSVDETEGRREIVFDRQVGEDDICETLTFLEAVGPSATVAFPYFRDAVAENGTALRICHASHNAVIYYPEAGNTDFCENVISSNEEAWYEQLKVFPNPVLDVLRIEGLPWGSTVELFDVHGYAYRLPYIEGMLTTSGLRPGIYFLQITLENGERWTERVVR